LLGAVAGAFVESLRDPACGDDECLPLRCPRCGEPMRIIAFVLDRDVIGRILSHIGEPTEPPAILPAHSPPQGELDFSRAAPADLWFEVDQTADLPEESWE
jgi:hypothetical protein